MFKLRICIRSTTQDSSSIHKNQTFQYQGCIYGFMTCSLIIQHSNMKRDMNPLLHLSGIFQNQAGHYTLLWRHEAETLVTFLADGARKESWMI